MEGSSKQLPPWIVSGIICFTVGVLVTIVGSKWLGKYDPPRPATDAPSWADKMGMVPPKDVGKGKKGPGAEGGKREETPDGNKADKGDKGDKGKGDAQAGGDKES